MEFLIYSYGCWLQFKQFYLPPSDWDYSFLEFHRKAVELESDPDSKLLYMHGLYNNEALRDLTSESIKEISPLIQFDPQPNHELKEVKAQLYKISVSFLNEVAGKIKCYNFHSIDP